MRSAARYGWIGYTAARSNMAYRGELLFRSSFLAVILYIFMRLWTVVYAESKDSRIAGLSLPQMLWYLVITEAVFLSAPRIWAEVEQDVRTGRLAVQLIRPLSYTAGHLSRAMGERIVRFTMNLVIGSIIALVLVGPIPMSISGLAMFAVTLPVAFVLDFLGMFLVGLSAFWLESTAGVALIYLRSVMLFGGMFLPLEIYPDALQPALRILPFASMVSAPGRMFVSPSFALLKESLITQGAAVVGYAGLVSLVQLIAFRRLFANGG
jgi:viologen exporter family transport system permease protein